MMFFFFCLSRPLKILSSFTISYFALGWQAYQSTAGHTYRDVSLYFRRRPSSQSSPNKFVIFVFGVIRVAPVSSCPVNSFRHRLCLSGIHALAKGFGNPNSHFILRPQRSQALSVSSVQLPVYYTGTIGFRERRSHRPLCRY